MNRDETDDDERIVQQLDDAWNQVYLLNDRAPFAQILADDFVGAFADLRVISKAQLMEPTPQPRAVSYSERALHVYGPTAVGRGRIRVEHAEGVAEQRYLRVYSKRGGRWQAVAVQVFPIPPGPAIA